MNVFEFVLAIVIVGIVGRTVQMWLAARGVAHEHRPDPAASVAQDEVRQLKERIQVLERVITDNHGSKRLDDEIERLRDR